MWLRPMRHITKIGNNQIDNENADKNVKKEKVPCKLDMHGQHPIVIL